MNFPLIKKTTFAERLFIIAALIVVGFILSAISSVAITIISKSTNLSELNVLRIAQISSQLFTFVFPPLLYACMVKEKPIKSLGFNRIPLWSLVGILMMFAILPLNNVFAQWNANLNLPESMASLEKIMMELQENANVLIEKMLNVNNIGGLIINLIMIAALAAIGEELLFRSILQPSLIRVCKNAHIGIFITSAIFSFIHFEFYGFIPRLVLGMLLGYMFFYSRSIWVPMIMHFVNNGTAVVLYYLNNKGITNIDVETFGQTELLPLILSIIIMIALFWFVIRSHNKEFKTENTEI
jgi:membrane protease YdiL (CAAX protease family)